MADITMCLNTLCPNAATCYRITATPSENWQSMAMFEYTVGVGGVNCSNYWQNYTAETAGNTSN